MGPATARAAAADGGQRQIPHVCAVKVVDLDLCVGVVAVGDVKVAVDSTYTQQIVLFMLGNEHLPVFPFRMIDIGDVDHLAGRAFVGGDQDLVLDEHGAVFVLHAGGQGNQGIIGICLVEIEFVGVEQAAGVNGVFAVFGHTSAVPVLLDFITPENLDVLGGIIAQLVQPHGVPEFVFTLGNLALQRLTGVVEAAAVGQPAVDALFPALQLVGQDLTGLDDHHFDNGIFIAAMGFAVRDVFPVAAG